MWTVALTADGQRLVVGAGEKEAHVRTFNRGGQPLWKRYVEGSVSGVAVSTGGEVVVVGTRAGHVYLFDSTGKRLGHHAAQKNIREVVVSAHGRIAAAASEDGHVYGSQLPLQAAITLPTRRPAWDTITIRELLTAAFNDEDLTVLCFDHFRSVYEDFGSGMSKGQKIQRLLDHCARHGQVEELLSAVEKRNRVQYDRFRDRLRG